MKPFLMQAHTMLWLDPDALLTSVRNEALELAGWKPKVIRTLDDLALHASNAQLLVLKLTTNLDRLLHVNELLAAHGLTLEVVCRVDRHELEIAVSASQSGVRRVIAADDFKHETWAELQAGMASNGAIDVTSQRSARSVVFVDPASQHLLALAQRVAQAEVTALLVGPTGAGKEVLARVLHECSPRGRGPFVAMNCAAMPEHLIEDMLFGHEKGAFTGAHKEHKGVFEQAQGGTLFLDEIGEMPMHLQSKLLRVLQEKQLTRLGGNHLIHLNVRIVAATNKDLRAAIEAREFREDLYYRIATFRLKLLPLRERPGDIIPLALQCLQSHGTPGVAWQMDAQAQSLLLEYDWPGNVRELENVMRRAMVLCPDRVIGSAHLMFDDWASKNDAFTPAQEQPTTDLGDRGEAMMGEGLMAPSPVSSAITLTHDLSSATRMSEHQVIMATLAQTRSREEAARRLGISPRTLRYKLAQFKALGLGMAA